MVGSDESLPYHVEGLDQEVDSEISNQIISLMVYFSIEDDTKDLYLLMNFPYMCVCHDVQNLISVDSLSGREIRDFIFSFLFFTVQISRFF